MSYYEKGGILGLLLDLEIRKRSNGTKSLDDVMRYLMNEFFKKDRNYGPGDFQKACELMAGSSLEEFFAKYVRGLQELDYNAGLSAAGLQLETAALSEGGKPVTLALFGAEMIWEKDRLIVRRVNAGSPPTIRGLNTGDQIIALNNIRVDVEGVFETRMAEKNQVTRSISLSFVSTISARL